MPAEAKQWRPQLSITMWNYVENAPNASAMTESYHILGKAFPYTPEMRLW